MESVRIREFGGHVGQEVLIRGWLHNKRSSGKLQFLTLRDGSGFTQVVLAKAAVPGGSLGGRGQGRARSRRSRSRAR